MLFGYKMLTTKLVQFLYKSNEVLSSQPEE